jgi:type II secretory pathway pseudopilin PulG
MTLVEVMVALVLLLITMLPLGYLVTNEVHQAATAKDRLAALGVAEKWVEILGTAQDPPPKSGSLAVDTGRQLIPQLPNGTSVPTATVGGTVFTILAEYDWTGTQDAKTPPDLCSSGGAQVLNLQVTVSWGRGQQVTDTTILDYPPPGIPQYGYYQLQFAGATRSSDVSGNSWSSRVRAIPVTFTALTPPVSPPPPVTVYPDQYGCVFAELIPGNYTVGVTDPSAGTPTGTSFGSPSFVENLATDGNHNPNEPTSLTVANAIPYVTIAAGVTTPLTTLGYDEGSTIGLSYPSSTSTADGVTCPGIVNFITCISEGEGTPGSLGWLSTTNPNPPNATLAFASGSTWSSAATPSSPPSPSSATSTRIASVACVSIACIGVGYGLTGTTSHGVILADSTTTPGTFTADTIPGNVASLTNVICPTAAACVAWGTLNTAGAPPVVLAGTISSGGDTWSAVTLPSTTATTMATLNQVACAPALPVDCVAVGSVTPGQVSDLWGWEASGPLFGSGTSGGTWFPPTVPTTGLGNPPNLTRVACPSAGNCMATGTGTILGLGLGPIAVSALFSPATPGTIAWTPVLPLVEPSSFSQLVCLPTNKCFAVGTVGTQAVIYSGTAGSIGSVILPILLLGVDYSVPGTSSSISQVTCPSLPSSSECVAIGSSTTSGTTVPVILSGAIGTTDTWSPNSIQTGITITSVSAVSCANTTNCAIAASNTSGANPTVAILYGTPGPSTSWSSATLPSADASTLYLTGISCTPTSGTSTCSAVGASPSSAVIMMATGGPAGLGPTGAWTDYPANSGLTLTGSPTSSIPIELAGGSLLKTGGSLGFWNPVAGTTTPGGIITNTTSISDIFPFDAGYGLFAGDCNLEDATGAAGSTVAATVPGNTAASPGSIVPLGVLPIQVTPSAVAPASGYVLTLMATTSGCAADTYTLQPTGPDGLSRTEVPFGSYSLKVTSGASSFTYTVIVAPGAVTVGSTLYLLPNPATVVGP